MVNIIELLAGISILFGSLFILVSAIGLIKMPDIFLRMSATTKAVTFGVSFVLIGAAIFFGDIGTITRAFVIILFLFLTAPVAAHMIGRAAYFDGVQIWDKTIVNEMDTKYEDVKHRRKARISNDTTTSISQNDESIGD
jgi:multicomponent Na+:H+ antiporter subunit G